MADHSVHYSSDRHDWRTPQDLFEFLHGADNFTHDMAALAGNAQVPSYFGPDRADPLRRDSLAVPWPKGSRCWLNPPYGRILSKFVEKAYHETTANPAGPNFVALLIPARPDTKAWQQIILQHATRIYFIAGRLKFDDGNDPAPFPSALIEFARVSNLFRPRPTFGRVYRDPVHGWKSEH